jgi:hypothetical protein
MHSTKDKKLCISHNILDRPSATLLVKGLQQFLEEVTTILIQNFLLQLDFLQSGNSFSSLDIFQVDLLYYRQDKVLNGSSRRGGKAKNICLSFILFKKFYFMALPDFRSPKVQT